MEPARAFRFCPACGRPVSEVTGRSPFRCAHCGFVFYFSPALAAVALIENAQQELLLIVRAKEPAKGRLAMPGGFVDVGEPIETALRREVGEEVGLELESVQFLGSFPNEYPYAGLLYPVLDQFFVCTVPPKAEPKPLDDVQSVGWYPRASVRPEDLAFPSMGQALRSYVARLAGGPASR